MKQEWNRICKRCKHKWNRRGKTDPICCPGCHSPYWNKERKYKKRKK